MVSNTLNHLFGNQLNLHTGFNLLIRLQKI